MKWNNMSMMALIVIQQEQKYTGYDHKSKLYHIKYEDGDLEDFFHNEVKGHQNHTVLMK